MSRPLKRIRIRPVQFGTPVNVDLGEGGPRIVTTDTGWTTKSRPFNVGFSEWGGNEPVAQEVPIRIDGFKRNRSIEFDLDHLRIIAGIGTGDRDGYAPSAVKIDGPIHFSSKRWIIVGIEEGESIRSAGNGQVIRWTGTLQIVEFINPAQIRLRRKKRPRFVNLRHIAREGDTLLKIAIEHYDDKSMWRKIGLAQKPPIRDPRRKIKPGRRIILPGIGGSSSFGKFQSGARIVGSELD